MSDAVEAYWASARAACGLSGDVPQAWSFGSTPEMADRLLALVLAGTKTAGASQLWDYEASGDPLPQAGDLSVVLDGAAIPDSWISATISALRRLASSPR